MKFFSLLYQGDVHPSTDEKIIPQEAYSKLLEAKELIEKAEEDCERKKQECEEECKRLRKEATQKGKKEGLETFNEQILYFETQLKTLRLEMQQMILPIALKAARKIVAKELEIFPETIVDIVIRALQPISQSLHVTLYVNKEDKEILEKNKPKLLKQMARVETLSIVEKSDISRGGCLIETKEGLINATAENQWKALERAFAQYRGSQ